MAKIRHTATLNKSNCVHLPKRILKFLGIDYKDLVTLTLEKVEKPKENKKEDDNEG